MQRVMRKSRIWFAGTVTIAALLIVGIRWAGNSLARAAGSGLVYSTFLGGTDNDAASGIAVDTFGNVYVTGDAYSPDFPTTEGAFDATYSGDSDAFVTKLDPNGALVYSTYLGGSLLDRVYGIAVDTDGNAYLTGLTYSTDFPSTGGAFDNSLGRAFVVKLKPNGNSEADLAYSTLLEGYGYGIAVDTAGNAYVTGSFEIVLNGEFYASVVKLDPNGALLYFTNLGGSGRGIAVDTDGNAYVAGSFQIDGNPASVVKLNATGDVVYSTLLDGSGIDPALDIAVDTAGNAYVTGYTSSSDFPTTEGAFDRTYDHKVGDDCCSAFVVKLDTSGALLYSTYLEGSDDEVGYGITADTGGMVYVTGLTQSSNFPTTDGAFDTSYNRGTDAFVVKLDTTASGDASLVYSTFLGGKHYDLGFDVALDALGKVHVTGRTSSGDFPTTGGAFDTSYNGSTTSVKDRLPDAFITKLDPNPVGDGGGGGGGPDCGKKPDHPKCK